MIFGSGTPSRHINAARPKPMAISLWSSINVADRRTVPLSETQGGWKRLRCMARMEIPEDWAPTFENVSALPGALRRYIRDLQTNIDPVGTMRENFRLRQENLKLRRDCELYLSRLKALARVF